MKRSDKASTVGEVQDIIDEYLKRHLRIYMEKAKAGYGANINDVRVDVELRIGDEVISGSDVIITEGEPKDYY